MPLRSFSKTASRRSSPVPRGILAAFILSLAAASASPQSLDVRVSAPSGTVNARLVFHWSQAAALIKSLNAGLESRINFIVRLYETRRGWIPFRGDRLLAERTFTRSAYLDRLDDVYVVEQNGGVRRTFARDTAALDGFFTVDDAPLAPNLPARGAKLYVVARAQFEPVQLMPPLTLVSLVGATASVATPWVRQDLP